MESGLLRYGSVILSEISIRSLKYLKIAEISPLFIFKIKKKGMTSLAFIYSIAS